MNKINLNLIIKIISPLLLVASALIVFFLIIPNYKQLSQKHTDSTALKAKEEVLTTKLNKLNDLIDFKQIVTEDLTLVNFALPDESAVPLLLTEIQLIAKGAGLSITNLSYSSSSRLEGTSADKVNVLLSAKGSFSQSKNFIETLEKASRIVDVGSMRFNSTKGSDANALESSEIEITLGLVAYFLDAKSKAVIEDPIKIDVRSSEFIKFINKLKSFKIYDTKVDSANIGKDNPFNQ